MSGEVMRLNGVEVLVSRAASAGASDLHIEPTATGAVVRHRIDGLLRDVETLETSAGRSAVARLMVLAELLTYRQDVPQEGRASITTPTGLIEARVSVMPTTHGLRAAVRLPMRETGGETLRRLDGLGLPSQVAEVIRQFIRTAGGMLLLTGPAGSGKTTLVYALLSELAHSGGTSGGLSVVSLEDPVERDLPGVTQVQVQPFGELTYERALRSLLRQDPQVLALGEVRDAATAAIAMQAALSGHRLVTTMHAGSIGGTLVRLLDMGLEPWQVCSGVVGVVNLRLVRRLCEEGHGEPRYQGRALLGEAAMLRGEWVEQVRRRRSAEQIDAALADAPGHVGLQQSAEQRITDGITDRTEVERVLGTSA